MLDEFASLDKLTDGIPNMPRRLTVREIRGDRTRFFLLVCGRLLILPAAVLGFSSGGLVGGAIGAGVAWIIGRRIRHSLGIRGSDGFHGWFQRVRERAKGSRRGLLEHMIEAIRGSGFTVEQCRAIIAAYDEAMAEMRLVASDAERQAIADRLDVFTKRISYAPPS